MAISSTKWLAALLLTAGSVACAVERQTESPALATAPVEDEDLDVDVGSLETNDTVDALAGDIDLVPSGRAVNGLVPLVTPTFVAAFQRLELSSGVVGENARLLELPLGLTTADVRLPANDPLDPSLAELGNLLFFDARLSAGSKIAMCDLPRPIPWLRVDADRRRRPRHAHGAHDSPGHESCVRNGEQLAR